MSLPAKQLIKADVSKEMNIRDSFGSFKLKRQENSVAELRKPGRETAQTSLVDHNSNIQNSKSQ